MSDHPLNLYKEIFKEFNIENYKNFIQEKNIKSSNIAATILKVQERKTGKGTPYAVVKFSDLSSVFEIFVFSEIFENSRDILTEGNSVLLSLVKNTQSDDSGSIRVNVNKILSLRDYYNKPIENIQFILENFAQVKKLENILLAEGNTKVSFKILENDKKIYFELEKKRKIDINIINILKKLNISSIIR